MKVHRVDAQAATRHEVAGNGRVDAAREHERAAPARGDRQAAGRGVRVAVDKGRMVAHLDAHGQIGTVHVDLQVGIARQQKVAHLGRDLRRGEGKALVGALGFNFEGACF